MLVLDEIKNTLECIGILNKCQIINQDKNLMEFLYKNMILKFYFDKDGLLIMDGIPINHPKIEGF